MGVGDRLDSEGLRHGGIDLDRMACYTESPS
jgi:hypothetical protein